VATPSRPIDDPALVKSFVTSTPAIPTEGFVTSTPAIPTEVTTNADEEGVNNYTYERSDTVRMDEIRDEMCDSYDDKPAVVMTNTEQMESPSEEEQEAMVEQQDSLSQEEEVVPADQTNGQSSSDDYDEEPDDVSTASQSPILGKSVERQPSVVDDEEDILTEDRDTDREEFSEQEEENVPPVCQGACAASEQDPDTMAMPSKSSRLLDPSLLPETCTMLTVPSGGRVYLVGTAHFSKESNEDVAAVIQAVKPDIVVLELCKARTSVLHLDEEKSLELAQQLTLEKVMEMVRTQARWHTFEFGATLRNYRVVSNSYKRIVRNLTDTNMMYMNWL